ncbi:MAG: siderophore-interacting protein [Burkholderiaceae bacterium]|nr:siderophore-interacting protein [Burkholderiaceae bacterium]
MTLLSSPSIRRVQRVRHDLRIRRLAVSRVQRISPGFAAVCFAGAELADFTSLSFDDHVKLMLPSAAGEPLRRDFTPRRFDAARQELTVEFALHGHGAAGAWATDAAPGQSVTIGGPRGSMVIAADHEWHLLAGDASALPAIHRRLEELGSGQRALVLVELADPADERRFDTAAQLELQWVRNAQQWLAALRELELPRTEGFVWCAGEARTMATARALLRSHHGHPPEAMRVSAYWKSGAPAFHEVLSEPAQQP